MNVLVFSDSHGNVASMKQIVARERPDLILHLGDMVRDAAALAKEFPQILLQNVCGNCDGAGQAPNQRMLTVAGKKLMLTHGHLYQVKLGMGRAVAAARESDADVLLFGHTHQALCLRQGPLWVMNPGSIQDRRTYSYGIIEWKNGTLFCRIVERNGEEEPDAADH